MKWKRSAAWVLTIIFMLSLLSACADSNANMEESAVSSEPESVSSSQQPEEESTFISEPAAHRTAETDAPEDGDQEEEPTSKLDADHFQDTAPSGSEQSNPAQDNLEPDHAAETIESGNTEEVSGNTMVLQIGERKLTATLVENSSTQALKELLADGPLTIDMRDYGNMEKVGGFGTSLPTNDESITTQAGDLILYQGNSFVIYYAPNSWSFTRLGKIDSVTAEELREVLGNGNVSVTLSLPD